MSNFILNCYACRKSQSFKNFSKNDLFSQVSLTSWQTRTFSPTIKPWFCSYNCAFESDKSHEVEVLMQQQAEFNKLETIREQKLEVKAFLTFDLVMFLVGLIIFGVMYYVH